MNVSTHSTRMGLPQMRSDLLPSLLATAAHIEADLDLAQGGVPRSAAGA